MRRPMERFPAFGGEALLFLWDTSELEEESAFSGALERVPISRREKVLRFKNRRAASLSLGAGLVLAAGLEAFGLDPVHTEFVYGEKEKPYVKGGGLFFNLSHSGSYALGIFSRREVGCDIQKMEGKTRELAERFFHPREVAFLALLPPEERNQAFFRLWALKESYIKAIGEGLSCSLASFCIDLEGPRVALGERMELEEVKREGYALGMAMIR